MFQQPKKKDKMLKDCRKYQNVLVYLRLNVYASISPKHMSSITLKWIVELWTCDEWNMLEKSAMTQSQRCHFSERERKTRKNRRNTSLMENSHSCENFKKEIFFWNTYIFSVCSISHGKMKCSKCQFSKMWKASVEKVKKKFHPALKWCLLKVKVKIGTGYSGCQFRSITFFFSFNRWILNRISILNKCQKAELSSWRLLFMEYYFIAALR